MKTKHTIVVTIETEEGKPVEGRDLNALLHEESCTVEYKGTDPKEIDAAGVEALLTELPRTLVGDGKTPNIYFVTNEKTGNVVAVFLGDDKEDAAIAFADSRSEALMVEDRLTGVVHDNPAGVRYQEECRIAEEAMSPAHTPDHPEADEGRGPAHTPDH